MFIINYILDMSQQLWKDIYQVWTIKSRFDFVEIKIFFIKMPDW